MEKLDITDITVDDAKA